MEITATQIYIGLVINGVCTGLGVAIGTYIANNHIIAKGKKIAKVLDLLKGGKEETKDAK